MKRVNCQVLCLGALLFIAGCASYSSRIREVRQEFEAGQYEIAIEQLRPLIEKNDNELLLYLLDLGIIYHTSGRYKEAIETFQKADKLAALTDYTSISQEAGTLLLNESVKVYKGEDFEKVLISVYLAMDYALMGDFDSSLIECRRVNHKLDVMINEGKLPYDHNAFAKYLSAMLFESQGEANDAWVDYRTAAKWATGFPYNGTGLLRMADKLKASQEFDEYKKEYSELKDYKIGNGKGEVVLLLEQGKAPYKVPMPEYETMPMFVRNHYTSDFAWMRAEDNEKKVRTFPLYDIEAAAIKELSDRTGAIIAKKLAGLVVKGAVGYGVAKLTKSPELGFLTAYALALSDQADTRSWTTLPARLQVARLTLPAGRHDIVLDISSRYGISEAAKKFPAVEVKSGKITFLNYRTRD